MCHKRCATLPQEVCHLSLRSWHAAIHCDSLVGGGGIGADEQRCGCVCVRCVCVRCVCGDERRSAHVVAHEIRCVWVCVCADEQTSAQLSRPDACRQLHRCRRPPLLLGLPSLFSLLFSLFISIVYLCVLLCFLCLLCVSRWAMFGGAWWPQHHCCTSHVLHPGWLCK